LIDGRDDYLPFPRNWLEELVAEYLQLEGYLVETGHPVQIGKGGRGEIDIIGFKTDSGNIEAIHVEIGRAESYKDLAEKIEKQLLSPSVCEERRKLSKTDKCECWFISEVHSKNVQGWQRLKKDFEGKGVKLVTFEELLQRIRDVVKKWKDDHKTLKGNLPMLPENLWLLKMLERIDEIEKKNLPI
jgi:hypothetical protein